MASVARLNFAGAGKPFVRCIQVAPLSTERQRPLLTPCAVTVAKMRCGCTGSNTIEWQQ